MYYFNFNLKGLFPSKILTSLKIALIFIMMSALPTFAGNYAQDTKLTIKQSNIELDKLLKLIEAQSDFSFFYSNDKIDKNLKVSVNATEKTIREILTQALSGSGINFRVEDKTIVLSIANAQQTRVSVKGSITDENGVTVGGVGIVEKGTTNGIVSDQNGNFSIQTGSGSVLEVSSLGYVTQEVAVGNRTEITIILAEAAENLDHVVVIGYGTVKRKDLTGSVTSLSSQEILKTNLTNVNHILKSQAPIDVRSGGTEPGTAPAIEIRGNTALITDDNSPFKQSNDPLWVVDGVPMQSSSIVLNPYDIVSIDLLQDASAAAIYGSRGANGVIIVTTKQAQVGEEKFNVSYDGWVGYDKVTRVPQLMNGQQYADYKRKANFYNGTLGDNATLDKAVNGDYDGLISFGAKERGYLESGQTTDWFDMVFGGTSFNTTHNLTVSTSGKRTGTVVSLGYLNQESLVPYAGYKRYNANFSNRLKVSDRLEFNTKILGTYSKNDHGPGATAFAWQLSPLLNPYDENGNLLWRPGDGNFDYNPIVEAKNSLNEVFDYNLIGSVAMKWNIWDNLNYEIAARADYSNSNNGEYYETETGERLGSKSPLARFGKTTSLGSTFDNILSYNKEFGGMHRIDAMAAFNTENYTSNYLFLATDDMTFAGLYYNMGTGMVQGYNSTKTDWTIMSFMGRVNYTLLDRYLVTATFRRDGSSRLSPGNKWTQYPALAFSWRLSDEPFMAALKAKFLDNLKLRLSYGNVGKMNIRPYSTLGSSAQTNPYMFGDKVAVGTVPSTIPNTNLKWEKTTEYNLGIDFGFFKGRLSGTIDLYDKNTSGLIMARNLPLTSGFSQFQMNIGKINNKGIQMMLKGDIIRSKEVVWNMGITFYKNKNSIVDLYGDKQDDAGSGWFIGQPIRISRGYEFIGVWQEGEEAEAAKYNAKPGYPKLRDIENVDPDNPRIDSGEGGDDRIIIPTDPKWIGNLNTTVSYKGFDLYLSINTRQGQRGGSNYEYQTAMTAYNSVYLESWTPENRSNEHPRPWLDANNFGPTGYGSYMLLDLSFVRISNVSLGYTLPVTLSRKFSANRARVFVNVNNPYVFSDYKGNDPETPGRGYPTVTAYQFGINLNF
jgi:TonB-linked SusC/RagA family outer membrane protein